MIYRFHKTADARKALELNETLFRGTPLMVQVPEKYWNPHHQRRYSQSFAGSPRGGYGEPQRRFSIQSKGSWDGTNSSYINRRRCSLLSQAADAETEQVDPSSFSPQDARSGITVPKYASGEDRGEGSKLFRPRTKSSGSSPKKSGCCTPSDRKDSGSTDTASSMHSSSGTGRTSPVDSQKAGKSLSRKNIRAKNKNKKNTVDSAVEAAPAASEEPLRKPSQIHTIVESLAEMDLTQSPAAIVPTQSAMNAPLSTETQAVPAEGLVKESTSEDPARTSVLTSRASADETLAVSNTHGMQDAAAAVQSEWPVIVSSTSENTKLVDHQMAAITVSTPKRDESNDNSTAVQDAESPASSKTVTFDLTPSGDDRELASPEPPVLSPVATLPTVKLPEAEPTPVQTQLITAELSSPLTSLKPTVNDTGSIHPFAKKNKPKKQQPKKPNKGEAKKQKKEQEVAARKDSRASSVSLESNTTTTLSNDNTQATGNAAEHVSGTSQPNVEVTTPQKTNFSGTPSPLQSPEDHSSPIQHFEDARESVSPKTPQPAESPPTLPASPTTPRGEQIVNPMPAASAPEVPQPVEVSQAPATPVKPAMTGEKHETSPADSVAEAAAGAAGEGGGQAVAGGEPAAQAATKKKGKSRKKKKNKKSTDSASTTV